MAKYHDFINKTKVLTGPELSTLEKELGTQIARAKLELGARKLKNLRKVFALRKQLAVIKTLQNK